MDHFSEFAADDLFAACVKSPLKLDLFSFFGGGGGALPAKLSGLSTGKVLLVIVNKKQKVSRDLDLKQSNNPTSAKFSDCNQVRRSCRLLGEAAVDVGETGQGQDNKRSAGGRGGGLGSSRGRRGGLGCVGGGGGGGGGLVVRRVGRRRSTFVTTKW